MKKDLQCRWYLPRRSNDIRIRYGATLVVWNDLLYSGSSDKTIQQWVDEEWEARQRQRQQDIRNLLLVYSRSMPPELDEDIVKEIATYF